MHGEKVISRFTDCGWKGPVLLVRSPFISHTGGTMNSDEYVKEIQHTREEIDKTLYTLEDKFSSRELLDQAIKWSGGAKELSMYIGRTVRDNPIPATLMAISLIWLMAAANGRGYYGGLPDVDIGSNPESRVPPGEYVI